MNSRNQLCTSTSIQDKYRTLPIYKRVSGSRLKGPIQWLVYFEEKCFVEWTAVDVSQIRQLTLHASSLACTHRYIVMLLEKLSSCSL